MRTLLIIIVLLGPASSALAQKDSVLHKADGVATKFVANRADIQFSKETLESKEFKELKVIAQKFAKIDCDTFPNAEITGKNEMEKDSILRVHERKMKGVWDSMVGPKMSAFQQKYRHELTGLESMMRLVQHLQAPD